MAELFTKEWGEAVRDAVNSFPDDEYRATKLDLFWNWIDVARQGFTGVWALGVRDLPANGSRKPTYAALTIDAGRVEKVDITDEPPEDSVYVLVGNYDVWKDIATGFDAGKAVMYRRLRLEKGDVFRFFNRIYFFTESLVALSKVPATLPQ
jgi:hypothetical protein